MNLQRATPVSNLTSLADDSHDLASAGAVAARVAVAVLQHCCRHPWPAREERGGGKKGGSRARKEHNSHGENAAKVHTHGSRVGSAAVL